MSKEQALLQLWELRVWGLGEEDYPTIAKVLSKHQLSIDKTGRHYTAADLQISKNIPGSIDDRSLLMNRIAAEISALGWKDFSFTLYREGSLVEGRMYR